MAVAYGLVRSSYHVAGAELEVFNCRTRMFEHRPMLLTERVAGILMGTFITVAAAPVVLAKDIYALELILRDRYGVETPSADNRKRPSSTVIGHVFDSLI